MADPQRLSLAEQAYVNIAFAVQAMREDHPDWAMMVESAAELRGHLGDGNPMLRPLVEALDARLAVAALPVADRNDAWRTGLYLEIAVQRFATWRAGCALDAWRAAQTGRAA